MFGLEFMIPNSSCLIHMQCISIESAERGKPLKRTDYLGNASFFSYHLQLDFSTMNCSAKERWKICLNKICASSTTKKYREKIFKVRNLFRILPQTWKNTKERLYLLPLTLLPILVIFLSWNLSLCAYAELTHFVELLTICTLSSFSSRIFPLLLWIKDNRVKHFIWAVSVPLSVCARQSATQNKNSTRSPFAVFYGISHGQHLLCQIKS